MRAGVPRWIWRAGKKWTSSRIDARGHLPQPADSLLPLPLAGSWRSRLSQVREARYETVQWTVSAPNTCSPAVRAVARPCDRVRFARNLARNSLNGAVIWLGRAPFLKYSFIFQRLA